MRFLFSCSALGKSVDTVQTLPDSLLSHADGAIAPASVLGPTTTKRSQKLVLRGGFIPNFAFFSTHSNRSHQKTTIVASLPLEQLLRKLEGGNRRLTDEVFFTPYFVSKT